MKHSMLMVLALLSCLLTADVTAQTPSESQAQPFSFGSADANEPPKSLADAVRGPVIERYGPVYPVAEDAMNLKKGKTYRVLMDVSSSGDFAMAVNPKLDSAARFLNMHAQNGIDPDDLVLSVVVHGAATKDLLSNEAYRDRFGVYNPNSALLEALDEAGVEVVVCGQSAVHKGYREEEFHPSITQAVSAMTAHVRRQAEGYVLIPF